MAKTTIGSTAAPAFATTAGLWAIFYLAAFPAASIPWWLAAPVAVALVVAAGVWTARRTGRGAAGGALMGLAVGLINLLALGSLLGGDQPGDLLVDGVWWIGGFIVITTVLATIGAALAGKREIAPPRWPGMLGVVLAVATGLMMLVGGLVTGLEAGMAFPDWLTTDGHVMVLFPARLMTSSVDGFAEHAHRLWGLLVGLTTIAFTVVVWRTDARPIRVLAIVALLSVIIQGVLGGTRVTENSIVLAIVHGVFGQMVFALIAALAAMTSARWVDGDVAQPDEHAAKLHRRSTALVVMLSIQLVLGALYRHLNGNPEVPTGLQHGILGLHILMALAVAAHAVMVGGQAWSKKEITALSRCGLSVLLLVGFQIVLGMGAVGAVMAARDAVQPPMYEVILTTVHQTTGAALLAMAAVTAAWARRTLAPA